MKPEPNKYYLLDTNHTYWSIDLKRMIKFVDKLVIKCTAIYNDDMYFGNLINTSEIYDDLETDNEIEFLEEDIIDEYQLKDMPLIYMDFPYIEKKQENNKCVYE